MPEGDTIFRTAAQLRKALQGQRILDASSRDEVIRADLLKDRQVTSIEARGKHLLIQLDSGDWLHSHLGMTGSWHLYQVGQAWRKPASRAHLSFTANGRVVVCFSPKTLELLSPDQFRRHRYLQRLGPDLLADAIDEQQIVARYRVHDATPIGEAIMNQTIACGVGNVYKSEVLYLLKIDPFDKVASLSDQELLQLIRKSRQLMQRNLNGPVRRTRFGRDGGRLWVYGRSGENCYVCGGAIQLRRQGDLGRTTYWCPSCLRD